MPSPTAATPAVPKKNIGWISSLRLVALFAVIILHTTSPLLMLYGKATKADWLMADFINATVRFAVPVFVMITGALLLHREEDTFLFLRKRLGRIVMPFLFWSLVYIAYSWYNEDLTFTQNIWTNIRMVLHVLKVGSSYHLWYVYMLIGLYFFIPVIGKFVRQASRKELLYFLVIWFGIMLTTQPYLIRYSPAIDMHYFAGFAGYLVLGHYLAFTNFKIPHLRLWITLLFLLCIAGIGFGSLAIAGNPGWPGTMFFEPLSPPVVMLAAAIFMLFKLSRKKARPFLARIRDFTGNYSYGIYLAHALILYLLDDLAGINYGMCAPIISIPVTALLCLVLSLLVVWAISRIPFIGRWISG
ncbi:MAG TPA: acyltransferase family protein [Mucilaginibacter sp.]|nr:acyltransferase family protein [Mucilaginibacter sp.]